MSAILHFVLIGLAVLLLLRLFERLRDVDFEHKPPGPNPDPSDPEAFLEDGSYRPVNRIRRYDQP